MKSMSMRDFLRKAAFTIAISITVLIIAVLGTTRPLAAASGETEVSLALDFVILGRHSPFFVALDKGFWAKRGLKVSIARGFGGVDTARRVGQKQADFGFSDLAAASLLRNKGFRLIHVAMIYHNWPHTIFAKPEIRSPKDLEGRVFGTPPGSTGRQLMPGFAKIAGVDWSKVRVINLDIATQNAGLISGRVDAISTFRFFIPFFKAKLPGVSIIPWTDYGWNMYNNGIVVHEDTYSKKADIVRKFLEGTLLGYKYAIQHPDEAVDSLLKYRPEIKRSAAVKEQPIIKELVVAPEVLTHGIGSYDPKKVQFTFDILYRYLNLPRSITPDQIYSEKLLPPIKF